ncbi:MAG: AMP-binding protein [Phycisphaerales bacterium]|nr:AMP-binding protein [Phycisphaerales bacterium]
MSVHSAILKQLLLHPRSVALVDDRRTTRNIELVVGASHIASKVDSVNRTDTLGILLPTSGAFPAAALAGFSLGRTIVPLNYLLKQEELQYVLDDCGTDTLVTVKPMLEHLGYTPRCKNIVLLDELDFTGFPDLRWPASKDDDDLAVLLYTSGTSGKPKGVMLTHGNILANMRQIEHWVDFSRTDSMLGVLPQFHSFGMTVLTFLPLVLGIKAVYTAKFMPQKIVRLIREHRPTVMVAIPSMYNALLSVKDAKPDDFASLRYIVSGGEPLPKAVLEKYRERFGVTINEGYGLTETSPVTNWCRPHEFRLGSVGRPLPEIDQRIIDTATGRSLPPNTDGEVWIKGPNVMKGYFNLPDETAKCMTPTGFFRTGDIGRLDDDGHLHITGRLKEMLIVGGENVFPREIEEVLEKHPSVNAAGVVGLMDPVRGELPLAFVEMRDGAAFDRQALITHCRGSLAGYKVPTDIRVMEALPRNATGKVMRRELKKLASEKI